MLDKIDISLNISQVQQIRLQVEVQIEDENIAIQQSNDETYVKKHANKNITRFSHLKG